MSNDTNDELFEEGALTIEGLEKEFGIKRSSAYELMNSGRLPWTCPYGRRLIPRAAVKKLLAAGLVGGQQTPAVRADGHE
jgi:hypothetical protein